MYDFLKVTKSVLIYLLLDIEEAEDTATTNGYSCFF